MLTWFMDASWSDLQHHHSGTLRPSGASTWGNRGSESPIVPTVSEPAWRRLLLFRS